MIRVWQHWAIRRTGLFAFAQSTVFLLLVLLIVLAREAAAAPISLASTAGLVLALAATQLGFYVNRLDALIVGADLRRFLLTTARSLGAAAIITAGLFALFPSLSPGAVRALVVMAVSTLLVIALRPLLRVITRRKGMVEGTLILGTGDVARRFYHQLANSNGQAGRVLTEFGRSLDGHQPDGGLSIHYDELRALTEKHRISRIVVAEPDTSAREGLAVALLDCKMRGLEVVQAVDSYERLSGKIWLEAVRPEWLIYSDGFRPSKFCLRVKQAIDFFGALLLLIVTAPLLGAIAIAIKMTSPGPVLFRQERVGQYGKTFTVYKFRSMRQDAEAKSGPQWAGENDPRITPIGRYLRKFRLDEMPQAINVIKGEMSLVGPRPERPYFVSVLQQRIPFYNLRHYVKPGITGWAQVMYPYGASIEDAYEKLQYDLYYAKHVSLSTDLGVLLKTVKVVIFGRGR